MKILRSGKPSTRGGLVFPVLSALVLAVAALAAGSAFAQTSTPAPPRAKARDLLPPNVQIPIRLPAAKSQRHPSEIKAQQQGLVLQPK